MSSGLLKFLSLLLAFTLGFLACAGSLVLGGVLIYNNVSYEKLQAWGLPLPSSDLYLDTHADVRLTALTVAALVEEIKTITKNKEEWTLNVLVDRYGVKLSEDVKKKLPPAVMELSLSKLASSEGLDHILKNTTLDYAFRIFADGALSEPAMEALSSKTLNDAMGFDLAFLFSEVKLGYMMDLNYQKNDAGEWVLIYADPAKPTNNELLAPLSLGDVLDAVMKDGDLWGVVKRDIGDCSLSLLMGEGDGLSASLTDGRTIADLISYSDTKQKHEMSFDNLLNDVKVGEVMGWEAVYDETDPENPVLLQWVDEDGKPATGVMKAFVDMTLDELTDSELVQEKIDDLQLYEALGYTYDEENDKYIDGTQEVSGIMAVLSPKTIGTLGDTVGTMKIYEVMEWEKNDDDEWIDKDGKPATGVMTAFAELSIDELSDGDVVQQKIDSLALYEALGYTYDETTGKYMDGDTEVDGVLAVLAPKPIGELGESVDQMFVGEMLGWEQEDTNPDPDVVELTWMEKDAQGNKTPASGIMLSFADLTVEQMGDNDEVQGAVDDLALYEALGYTKLGDDYYKTEECRDEDKVTGILAVLAPEPIGNVDTRLETVKIGEVMGWEHDGTQWIDNETNAPATGMMASFADLTIDEMSDGDTVQAKVDDMYLYDVMGWKQNDAGEWVDKNDKKISGIMTALADSKVSELDSNVDGLYIGEIMGWTAVYDTTDPTKIVGWLDNGAPAKGIMASFASLTVAQMSDEDEVQRASESIYLHEVLGYTLQPDGSYTDKNDNTVSGIMKVLAPKQVGEMNDAVGKIYIGEVMGWEPVYDTTDPTKIVGWLDNDAPAKGIMASFAGLTVDEMSQESKVQGAVNDLYLYDVLGFTVVDDGNGNVTYMDNGAPVTGLLKVLAPKKVEELHDDVDGILVGEMMGWTPVYVDPDADPLVIDHWMDADSKRAEGFVVAFANLTLKEMSDSNKVQATVNGLHLYEVMGYTEKDGSYYSDPQCRDEDKVTGILAALSPEKVEDLDATISNLRLTDVFTAEQLNSGFLKLLDPNTRLYKSDSEPGLAEAAESAFKNATLAEVLVGEPDSADLIDLDDSTKAALALMDSEKAKPVGYWKTLTLQGLIEYILEA